LRRREFSAWLRAAAAQPLKRERSNPACTAWLGVLMGLPANDREKRAGWFRRGRLM
jgi:hypothetical protein